MGEHRLQLFVGIAVANAFFVYQFLHPLVNKVQYRHFFVVTKKLDFELMDGEWLAGFDYFRQHRFGAGKVIPQNGVSCFKVRRLRVEPTVFVIPV